ncbi:MAG: bifunctional 4-hydroxy-2-oxoglutarate aldolase/2-dehydro-3-deoxy-phosphogluconate aldolase [Bacteroidia bacterium]|nr:bifunctional 4-hydroxy-2-oxoglutarate aldolase/2-dehydro-3-deoxy-phosphogluconate aldolase [Bacteroidia bacterium]
MKNKSMFWNRFDRAPIVGIIRGVSIETVRRITESYLNAGFYTLEITMNTGGAVEIISALRKEFPELSVGAGTVCNMTDLKKAIDAGSQFIVAPILDEEVVGSCVAQNIPIFPGAYSPTEIYKAWTLGASAVKIFPATQLGTQFIKDILAPLNQIKLLPTGGITISNIKSFFHAGAYGVGMGSSLLDAQLIKEENFYGLKDHFTKIKNEILEFIEI